MQGQCVVAIYPSRTSAEEAWRELHNAGIPDDHVRLSDGQPSGAGPAMTGTTGSMTGVTGSAAGSFWDWLFGTSIPEEDRRMYESRLSQGQTALSVLLDGSPSIAPSMVEDILERCGPLDLHVEDGSAADITTGAVSGRGAESEQKERVIPLPQEELKVGKRATEQVHRIRTYVVEEPVQ